MSNGKVLAAAKAKGMDSLTKLAQALVTERPELFTGVEVRSLGAKLSELNREKATWWRNRNDRLEALRDLLGLEPSDLIASAQARRYGLWVCDEFPEIPGLNLANEQPPTLVQAVSTADQDADTENLDNWLSVGLGSDYEQHPMARLPSGVRWLHAPKGTGRSLLLARIKARGRIDVFEGNSLVHAVSQVSRSRPAVLAPLDSTAASELAVLAQLDSEQPVLIISLHPLPTFAQKSTSPSQYPSWEWLSATRSERVRSGFSGDKTNMSGGNFSRDPVIGFKLQLVTTWRAQLLNWIDERFPKNSETLFTAEGLNNWLEAFDPDEVMFPTPSAMLSLARICHEVGEHRLPKPSSKNAGMQLVKQLTRADSRYLSLLARLVTHCWLDTETAWQHPKPWRGWLTPRTRISAQSNADKTPSHHSKSVAINHAAPLTDSDLDAAVKAGILTPARDGNYGFRSYAEAALTLTDQLRDWMKAGEHDCWAAPAVGDAERYQLVDEVLRTLDNQILLEMCRLAVKLPMWSAEALGASEALFLAIGLRMAEGTLSYRNEHGDLLTQTLNRCLSDKAYVQIPLSRPQHRDIEEIDWIRASWGWSLIAPKPKWVPASLLSQLPGWATGDIDWLGLLPAPASRTSLSNAHFRRMAQAVDTAIAVADRVGIAKINAPEVLMAVVGLSRAALNKDSVQASWWQSIAHDPWALKLLEQSLVNLTPAVQRVLAASLLETCSKIGSLDSFYRVSSLVHSRLWLLILNVKDTADLCNALTSAAMGFVLRHITLIPPALRRAVADRIDTKHLPHDFDWIPLLSATDALDKRRLHQLLGNRHAQSFNLSAALWQVHPNFCMEWALDADNPHHDLLIQLCPPQWSGQLAETLILIPELVIDLNIHPEWVMSRIAEAGPGARALLALLSSAWNGTLHDD